MGNLLSLDVDRVFIGEAGKSIDVPGISLVHYSQWVISNNLRESFQALTAIREVVCSEGLRRRVNLDRDRPVAVQRNGNQLREQVAHQEVQGNIIAIISLFD